MAQERTLANVVLHALGEAPIDQRRGADANLPTNHRAMMAHSIGSATFPAIVRDALPDKPGVYRLERCRVGAVARGDDQVAEFVKTGQMIDATPDAGVDATNISPGVMCAVLASGDDTFTFTLTTEK